MEKPNNPPAFPLNSPDGTVSNQGMVLLDYFAAHAMQGFLMNQEIVHKRFDNIPQASFVIAKQMLAERNKGEKSV